MALFPQLVAGPIVRYTTVMEEIAHREESLTEFAAGATRFCFGLAKKMVLANSMGQIADGVFGQTAANLGPGLAWVGALAYTCLLYTSAYTAVKERAAGVELEAHCRAQNVLNEADGQARELRRGMEQWLGRVQLEYDALRSEVESTVSHAADQLEKAGKCLEQVNACLLYTSRTPHRGSRSPVRHPSPPVRSVQPAQRR